MSSLQKTLVLNWIKYKSSVVDLREIQKICEDRAKIIKRDIHTLVLKYFGELRADYEKINGVKIYVTYFTDIPDEYQIMTDSSLKYCFRIKKAAIRIWIVDVNGSNSLLDCNVIASFENSIITEHCPTHGHNCEMERGLHRTQLIPKIVHISTTLHPKLIEYIKFLQHSIDIPEIQN
jgi:hypothetical protein